MTHTRVSLRRRSFQSLDQEPCIKFDVHKSKVDLGKVDLAKVDLGLVGGPMPFRWRLWTRLKLLMRKHRVLSPQLPYELDEFAKMLSSPDPTALKQLAAGLGRPVESRPRNRRRGLRALQRMRMGQRAPTAGQA
jgi:hypothetical protein